jgi:dihydrolipoamide dehydrogenase
MADVDLAIIGSGPGGYVAAIRAGQLGMKVACVEREAVGGVCLNWGCIPSKALIRHAEVLSTVRHADAFGITTGPISADYAAAVARSRKVVDRLTKGVAGLLRKHSVEVLTGVGRLGGPGEVRVSGAGGERALSAGHVIIATGARAMTPPGIETDGQVVVTYREAILQESAPERIVIIGGGAIGAEFAYIYRAYGAQVSIVELEPRLLPREDEESSKALTRALDRQGIEALTGSKVAGVSVAGGIATVSVETPDGPRSLEADRVLVAVGIRPNTEGLGLEEAGVRTERGYVQVDGDLRTSARGVYAIGDVTGIMPLAHVAQAQAVHAVEHLAGLAPQPLDYAAMPRAVYTNPQVASVGLTESEAQERGQAIRVGKFPLLANGKALALGEQDGFAKVIVDDATGELLGAHLVGHEVTEMLGELSLTRLLEGTDAELGAVVHPHPTLSEAIKEAALAAGGQAIHI